MREKKSKRIITRSFSKTVSHCTRLKKAIPKKNAPKKNPSQSKGQIKRKMSQRKNLLVAAPKAKKSRRNRQRKSNQDDEQIRERVRNITQSLVERGDNVHQSRLIQGQIAQPAENSSPNGRINTESNKESPQMFLQRNEHHSLDNASSNNQIPPYQWKDSRQGRSQRSGR